MKILTGIDIVDIEDFRNSLNSGGSKFVNRLFTEKEKKNSKVNHLAGLFAAKEAVLKALSLPSGSWQEIEIVHKKNGRPFVILSKKITKQIRIIDTDVSISHSISNAIAIFIAIT
jgi:holo-[acyl-carrier protein] synthase